MIEDRIALYNACAARDPSFDGVFFVGVTSTGIYCRPICKAQTPKAANCRFFAYAAAAEKALFRPCLRCRPELAPGIAVVDDAHRVARLIARRIEEGMLGKRVRLGAIASQLGQSPSHVRRILHQEFGVSPTDLALTRRFLLAKQLLSETALPITDVAVISGFSGVRRFNDAFAGRYRIDPSRLRKTRIGAAPRSAAIESITLQLTYREPFDWPGLLRFLGMRALKGIESIHDDEYLRTAQLGEHTGWIRVRNAPERRAILVEIAHSLTPMLPTLLGRLQDLFDLSGQPDLIAAQLAQDPLLADAIVRNPGLRVPGAFDGFELATRAVLGQQVTVKAATTLAGRFVEAFGEPIATPHPGLARLAPTPQRVAAATAEELASLGIIRSRGRTIIILAEEIAAGRLMLEAGASPEITMQQLVALPGIGPWTAHYIAMRALRWPDAFPREDIALRNSLGRVSAAQAEALSQVWRPWRSYATLHLWHRLSETHPAPQPAGQTRPRSYAIGATCTPRLSATA